MTDAVRNRGPSGQGSIIFRQNPEYPREPGQITYYPPEPSNELKKQMLKDKGGGLSLYIIGFAIVVLGYIGAMGFSDEIQVYATLLPVLLVLGLVFAIMYLFMNNIALAKLSRAMPMILLVCMVLMYIISILSAIFGFIETIGTLEEGGNGPDDAFSDLFGDLFISVLNPAFFLMSAGFLICLAGGGMLLASARLYNQFIPGMIIMETPAPTGAGAHRVTQAQPTQEPAGQTMPTATGSEQASKGHPAQQEPGEQMSGEESKPCGKCNRALEYIEEYGRYYCYECQDYAPKDI